jgi:hypothetical protein
MLDRAPRAHYQQLVADAVAAGELRADINMQALVRMIDVTLGGSFLVWTLYREGAAADWLREDVEAALGPHLAHGHNQVRRR